MLASIIIAKCNKGTFTELLIPARHFGVISIIPNFSYSSYMVSIPISMIQSKEK